jgi:hypothetical protein
MRSLSIYPEAARIVDYNPSDYVNTYVLSAFTTATVTIPTGGTIVAFSATAPFYATFGTTSTTVVPTANITNGTGAVLNPTIRSVNGISVIGLIAPTAAVVTVSYYNE